MTHGRLCCMALLLLFTTRTALGFQSGASLTLPVFGQDPRPLHGYRGTVWLQPDAFLWPQSRVYFDLGFGHWWVPTGPNKSLSIYSLAPVFRYYFLHQPHMFSPFINFSIGAAWMTRTRFSTRNLGMHFTFQDEVGLGVNFGPSQRFSLTFSTMHYSNASFSNHNSGITIPLLVTVAMRFD